MWKALLLSSLAFGVPTKQAPTKASANEKQEMAIPQLTRDVLSRIGEPIALTKAEQKLLAQVVAEIKANPEMKAAPQAWKQLIEQYALRTKSLDVLAVISLVMKESVLEQKEDAKYWANRLAFYNQLSGELSDYLDDLKKKLRTFTARPKVKVSAARGVGHPEIRGGREAHRLRRRPTADPRRLGGRARQVGGHARRGG